MKKRVRGSKRRWRPHGSTVAGVVAAVAVVAFAAVAYALFGGGSGGAPSSPVESRSHTADAGPFEGGARLFSAVDTVDLGQVPLNQVVSYAFDISNVGDATLSIDDIHVAMLEGC